MMEEIDFIQPKKTVGKLISADVLDKIRAEIEQTTSRYTISRERGAMGQVEWSDRLIKESEILEILDKYKAESEPQEINIEKRKPCINFEDGCEEWAGCPCVYYKAESEEV